MTPNPFDLSPRQMTILTALLESRSVSSEDMQQAIYGTTSPQKRATVGVHISDVRKALAQHGVALDFDWDTRRYLLTRSAKKKLRAILVPPAEIDEPSALADEQTTEPELLSEHIARRREPANRLDRDVFDALASRKATISHLQDILREHGYNARWRSVSIGSEPGSHFRFCPSLMASPIGSSAAMCAEATI